MAQPHPAVVLPLQRLGLPLSALVVGAVAPDAPVYLPVGVSYPTTHSGGGLAIDVVIGLVVLWLWFALLRDAVVDLTPALRRRVPARARLGWRAWLLAPLALAIGSATHVLWDSCTHDWGFVVQELAFLREEYGPIPRYRWLQHASTVVGSVVVATYGVLPPAQASRGRSTARGSPALALAGSGAVGRPGRRDRPQGPERRSVPLAPARVHRRRLRRRGGVRRAPPAQPSRDRSTTRGTPALALGSLRSP